MPYKDPVRQREFQRKHVALRRAMYLDGKACVDCGATTDLEFDHRDPSAKESHRIWSWSKERLEAELAKCDVRCSRCHRDRHAAERRRHGIGGYQRRGCRCVVCCAAKRRSNQRSGERRRRESNARVGLCRPVPNHSATAPGQLSLWEEAA